jgi:hypothetical protein
MQNTKQKKKVSYDDILASLKMSVNGNGKLEIVRTDADETKLKDQLVQKYSKPIKPNNSRPAPSPLQQHQQPPNRSNAAKPQFNRPVTRTPIKPMPQSFIHSTLPPIPPPTPNKTKANYLASYFSKDKDVEDKEDNEVTQNNEIKLKIVELDEIVEEQQPDQKEVELTEEEQQELEEQYEQYRENYRQQQEYNKAVILHKINQHNQRVMIRQSKSKKLLFATSNIRISPSPINSLFNMK